MLIDQQANTLKPSLDSELGSRPTTEIKLNFTEVTSTDYAGFRRLGLVLDQSSKTRELFWTQYPVSDFSSNSVNLRNLWIVLQSVDSFAICG